MTKKIGIYTPTPGFPPEAAAVAENYEGDEYLICHRNAAAWKGGVEDMHHVYAADEQIREAYQEIGVGTDPLFPEFERVPEERREDGKDFYLRDRGSGWYDVVSAEGEPANEDALREGEAKALRDELNGVEPEDGEAPGDSADA